MSWAAHDPEGWDEVCLNGVLCKIRANWGSEFDRGEQGTIEQVLKIIRDAPGHPAMRYAYDAWCDLVSWAGAEVSDAEADYFVRRGSRE